MIFKIILDIFLSGASSLPGILRYDALQKKPTLGVTKLSSNSKEILQCMLRRTFFLNVIPVQTKQSYNEATDGKKLFLCGASCNNEGSCGTDLFF